LPSVEPVRASWKVLARKILARKILARKILARKILARKILAIVRTIPALDRRVRRAVLCRSGRELGGKDLSKVFFKSLRLTVVNGLDQPG
jgi:hypothetical protein